MRVGILTGGGDCPGLNAVIRAVVKRGTQLGHTFVGIKDGWRGLISANYVDLDTAAVAGLLARGGTILGTSRTNPFKKDGDVEKVLANLKKDKIDALVCIGGDDTLGVASKLFDMGIKTVGVPKTIDNDLSCTDFTFGFDTAISIVCEAMDRLRTTTEAHHRVMVVEVMGRHAGWIAVYGGLAGGADLILIPEEPFGMDEVCRVVQGRKQGGFNYSIIMVAEGAMPKQTEGFVTKDSTVDAFGHVKLGGIGEMLAKEIEKRTSLETRHVVLGHLQRGGSPTAHDRILATRYGVKAIELVHEGKFGRMAALNGNKVVDASLKDSTGKTKTVDKETYEVAKVFFG
ncbi:MAG: 6-phosphofructokinase [Deltaproteobacteria bacterium]|nr:6-phosphofructokinase [Deltaproteobacteria bacterium]